MRNKSFLFGLISACLLVIPSQAGAANLHSMTRCNWLAVDGRSCTQKQATAELFYRPAGPVVGCRSVAGVVTLHGKSIKHHPQVALTFDDGPSTYTPAYLRVLKKYGVKATFFLIGSQISSFPGTVTQELAEGHIIGNHSWSHPMMTSPRTQVASQLAWTQKAIFAASSFQPCFMRPPYGAWNRQVQTNSAADKLQIILWDVDTQDWSRPGVTRILHNALSEVSDGSIILMHDGGGERSQTLAALPQLIQSLRARGFHIVRLDKLLGTKLLRS